MTDPDITLRQQRAYLAALIESYYRDFGRWERKLRAPDLLGPLYRRALDATVELQPANEPPPTPEELVFGRDEVRAREAFMDWGGPCEDSELRSFLIEVNGWDPVYAEDLVTRMRLRLRLEGEGSL